MCAASRSDHSDRAAKVCPPEHPDLVRWHAVRCGTFTGSKVLQDACPASCMPAFAGSLPCVKAAWRRSGRRSSTATSVCSCCAQLRALWRRTSASCRMSCARQALLSSWSRLEKAASGSPCIHATTSTLESFLLGRFLSSLESGKQERPLMVLQLTRLHYRSKWQNSHHPDVWSQAECSFLHALFVDGFKWLLRCAC